MLLLPVPARGVVQFTIQILYAVASVNYRGTVRMRIRNQTQKNTDILLNLLHTFIIALFKLFYLIYKYLCSYYFF